MLLISKRQMDAFWDKAHEDFETSLMEHLREHHPDRVKRLKDDMLRRRVRLGIQRAQQYGMTWQSTITAFVSLMFEVSPVFYRQKNIRRSLQEESVAPDQRLDAVLKTVTDADWAEARALRLPSDWETVETDVGIGA